MGFWSRLSIGTKIIVNVTCVLLVCMFCMSFLILQQVSKTQKRTDNSLLLSVGREISEIVNGIYGEVYTSVRTVNGTLEEIINDRESGARSQATLENELKNTLDSSNYGIYAFVYIKDSDWFGDKIVDSKHRLPNGEFLILVEDTDVTNAGGLKVGSATDSVVKLPTVERALNTGKVAVGNPFYVNLTGKNEFINTITIPIKKNGIVIGAVGMMVNLDTVGKILNNSDRSVFDGDYRFLLSANQTIASHPNTEYLGKKLVDIPGDKQQLEGLANRAKEQYRGIFEYTNYANVRTLAGMYSFEVGYGTGSYWTAAVLAPVSSVNANAEYMQRLIAICSIVTVLIIVLYVLWYIKANVSSRIVNILSHLRGFFKCLNFETDKCPMPLRPKAQDELGQMAMEINLNIEKTQESLDRDGQAVVESVNSVKIVESGDLTARITAEPFNPKLRELKDVLNQLLETLEKKVGSDLNELDRVFNSYASLNFTTDVKNTSGRVEQVTNTLGKEIRTMLKSSNRYAIDLTSKTDILKGYMQRLTEGSQSQASSLQQSAAAIEEI
ncbi:PDC sensor domain-containing protein, partial [Helicobacter sp. WB40]